MKYWTRTTHNFNNETREWEFRKEIPFNCPDAGGIGVHALESGRWMTESEVISENLDYFEQQGLADGLPAEHFTRQAILDGLKIMEAAGLVKSKEV
jgi:hypothetical protein